MVVILSGLNALLSGCLIMLLIIVGEQYGCVLENVRVEFIWVIFGSIDLFYWGVLVVCRPMYILEISRQTFRLILIRVKRGVLCEIM